MFLFCYRSLTMNCNILTILLVFLVQSVVHSEIKINSDVDSISDTTTTGCSEFYNQVLLTLNQRFHQLDSDMNKMLIEDPVDEFIETEDKPLVLRMEYLEENITTAMKLNGSESAALLAEIIKERELIFDSMAANDKKHKENIELRDERRTEIRTKISNLLSDLKDGLELQNELGIGDELDTKFEKDFRRHKISVTTISQLQSQLETIELMEQMASNPDEFVKKTLDRIFDPTTPKSPRSFDDDDLNEKYNNLMQILVEKNVKPSNLIATMLEKLTEGKEVFESKLHWKYENMADKYMSFAIQVTAKKWNTLVENIMKLEELVELQLKDLISLSIEEEKRKLIEEHDEL